jgi:hypothetical protein
MSRKLLLWVEECREVHSTIRHEEERMDGGKDGEKEWGVRGQSLRWKKSGRKKEGVKGGKGEK